MYWRAAAYYLAQQIGTAQVGMEFNLLDGFEGRSNKANRTPVYDPKVGFSTAAKIDPLHLERWERFISGERRGAAHSIT